MPFPPPRPNAPHTAPLRRRQFLSAWNHVASMAGPDDIRDDYASFLTSPSRATVRKTVEALSVDVSGLLIVLRSHEGARAFRPAVTAIEGACVVEVVMVVMVVVVGWCWNGGVGVE